MINSIEISEDIRHEFLVNPDGSISASRRGVARLCDFKSENSIRNLLKNILRNKNLSEPLKPFAGQDFEGAQQLPDILVSAIVSHYAFKGKEQAQKVSWAFQAVGIRTWFQQQLGWQPPTQPENPMTPLEMYKLNVKILEDHERRIKEQSQIQKAQFRIISKTHEFQHGYTNILRDINNHVDKLHNSVELLLDDRVKVLKSIDFDDELSDEKPSKKPLRKKVWRLVNIFASYVNIPIENCWSYFYDELYDRYGFNAKARAKNQGIKPIDAVDREPKMMENLYAIVSDKFRETKPKKILEIENNLIRQEELTEAKRVTGERFDRLDLILQRENYSIE